MKYNFHIAKYKMSDVGGIKKEQFREYDNSEKYKNYVDPERSGDNRYIEMVEGGSDWFGQIHDAKEHTKEITGKGVRKDAVVLCSGIESVPESWPNSACVQYFEEKGKWFNDYLHEKGGADDKCLKTVSIHLDETTPHATYAWIPEKDGRLQVSNIMTRDFLRDLQKDGQDFTFKWIDNWNKCHPDCPLEKIEEYTPEMGRRHLTEAEYKEQKIQEHVAEMQKDLEQKVLEITQAPDLPAYEKVVAENQSLREELTIKERLIDGLRDANEKLQETVHQLKEQATEWKDRFREFAQEAGQRMMSYFGYEAEGEKIREYPSKEFAKAYDSMKEDVYEIDPKNLRTIPDNEEEGKFRVVQRIGDEYETVMGGFDTRTEAETWQKDLALGAMNLNESLDEGISLHR